MSLDAVVKTEDAADIQQLLVIKEEVERSSSLDQEDPPEPPHIKEEQEELWTCQEGEQLPRLEEADIKFTFSPVPVKSEEDNEEEPQSSQLHQRQTEQVKTESDEEDCGGPESDGTSDPDRYLRPADDDKTSHFLTFSLVPVKSEEEDEEKPQSSQLHQIKTEEIRDVEHLKTEAEREFCGGPEPEPVKDSDPDRYLRPADDDKMSHFLTFSLVPVKSEEEDEEEPQSSQLHQIKTEEIRDVEHLKTEAEGEFCGGPEPEPAKASDPDRYLRPADDDKMSHFLTFTPVTVKSEEDDEEEPQSSQLHQRQTEQMETEDDGEDCGGPEPAWNFNPDSNSQPDTSVKISHPEPESDDSWDWEDTREPQSGLNLLHHDKAPVSDVEGNGGTGVRPFGCSVCGKRCSQKNSLTDHMRLDAEEKRYSCSVCDTSFDWKRNLMKHMKIHAGKKPFTCSDCGIRSADRTTLTKHLEVQTGEQCFSCSICSLSFSDSSSLSTHMSLHTRSNLFRCSVCKTTFQNRCSVLKHMRVHTGEKPFRCSVCGKRFAQNTNLKRHLNAHTGAKPFSCSVCGKRFTQKWSVTAHEGLHMGEKLAFSL